MGIKSRFSDYFPIYIEHSKGKPTSIKELANEIDSNEKNWSYFEKQLGEYTKHFSSTTKYKFLEQLKDFQDGFIDYLKKQESKLSFDNSDDILNKFINALMTFYSSENLPMGSSLMVKNLYDSHRLEEHRYNFINFNYTSILEKCLQTIPNRIVCKRAVSGEKIDRIGQIVHVHGYCDQYPLMGLDNDSQIINKSLAQDKSFSRYVVKPSLNEALRMNYDKNSTELILRSQIICVYGMSLGETDKKWWNLILNWLSKDAHNQLIIYNYDEQYTFSNQFAWIDKEDEIVQKLSSYSNNEIKIEDLISRIHISVNKNIFQMNLLVEKIEDILVEELNELLTSA